MDDLDQATRAIAVQDAIGVLYGNAITCAAHVSYLVS